MLIVQKIFAIIAIIGLLCLISWVVVHIIKSIVTYHRNAGRTFYRIVRTTSSDAFRAPSYTVESTDYWDPASDAAPWSQLAHFENEGIARKYVDRLKEREQITYTEEVIWSDIVAEEK